MVVRLRLAMHGNRNKRIFHLVAINNPRRRNAKPIETLGVFDPRTQEGNLKTVQWNPTRIKHWLSVGAEPTDRVVRLLETGQLLDPLSKWLPGHRLGCDYSIQERFTTEDLKRRRKVKAAVVPPELPQSLPSSPQAPPVNEIEEMESILKRLDLTAPEEDNRPNSSSSRQ